jgi:hypothetical protein
LLRKEAMPNAAFGINAPISTAKRKGRLVV